MLWNIFSHVLWCLINNTLFASQFTYMDFLSHPYNLDIIIIIYL